MVENSLAPGLLLAMPQLLDPNFQRSVVLLVQHDARGSLGLVVNRPSDATVADVLEPMGIYWGGARRAVVWVGGPVMPQSGWLLHDSPLELEPEEAGEPSGSFRIVPGMQLTTSPDHLRTLAEDPPANLRFLMGYAGWGAGQLTMELAEGAWLALEASAELIFGTPSDAMWETALRTLGVDPGSLFPASGVH